MVNFHTNARVCESAKISAGPRSPAEVTSLGDLPEFCLTY